MRQIVSNLTDHYGSSELLGKKVVVLTNLKYGKFGGQLSEGMVLTAIQVTDKGTVQGVLTTDAEPGALVRWGLFFFPSMYMHMHSACIVFKPHCWEWTIPF